MSFIESMNVPGFKTPKPNERVLRILSSPELGSAENMTLLHATLSLGSATGLHTHECTEALYVLSGSGVGVVSGKTREIRPDTLLFIPRGTPHDIRNTGDEPLKLFSVNVPSRKPSGDFKEAVDVAKPYFGTRS